jgi:CheY-like chemotaxis protein
MAQQPAHFVAVDAGFPPFFDGFTQHRPRVMIVDILLPGIDGVALIDSLRSHP